MIVSSSISLKQTHNQITSINTTKTAKMRGWMKNEFRKNGQKVKSKKGYGGSSSHNGSQRATHKKERRNMRKQTCIRRRRDVTNLTEYHKNGGPQIRTAPYNKFRLYF